MQRTFCVPLGIAADAMVKCRALLHDFYSRFRRTNQQILILETEPVAEQFQLSQFFIEFFCIAQTLFQALCLGYRCPLRLNCP